jgi:hypothetical protein
VQNVVNADVAVMLFVIRESKILRSFLVDQAL